MSATNSVTYSIYRSYTILVTQFITLNNICIGFPCKVILALVKLYQAK